MNSGSLIAKTALPAYFKLKGLPVVRLLKEYEQSQWWSRDRLQEQASDRLARVLRAAHQRSPFYAERFRAQGFAPEDVHDLDDLAQLPVLEKRDLAALYKSVRRTGTRFERRTAGTSGLPSVVLASCQAQAAALAARYRCYGWYGLKPGDREARFWGRPIQRASIASELKRVMLNRVVFDYRHIGAEAAADTYRHLLDKNATYVYGYASLLIRLARQFECRGLPPLPNLRAAVLTAEGSTETERAWLGQILDCEIADEYGCSEVDIITFTCPAGGRHIMSENIIVETVPLPGQDDLHELLITDLNNELMPMIRYRLGDLGQLSDDLCPCGRTLPLITGVRGRAHLRYMRTPDGRLVHTSIFAYFMEQQQSDGFPIRQFQVVQAVLDRVEVNLVMDDVADQRDRLRRLLERFVKTYCGDEMGCRVNWVDEIAPVPGYKLESFISKLGGESGDS